MAELMTAVSLRAVQTSDFMTAKWAHLPYELLGKVSNRIINEVKGINRVCYDVSGKLHQQQSSGNSNIAFLVRLSSMF